MTVYTPASPQCPKCGQQRELVCPKCHWDEVLILRERLARMEQRTCGNCSDWIASECHSATSPCANAYGTPTNYPSAMIWPVDHGCPQWRQK